MEVSSNQPVAQDAHRPEYALLVRNATKTRFQSRNRRFTVFKNLNLTLTTGAIYGLLGPSGCGKTTLFRCILGTLHLDQGTITLFGHSPGCKKGGVPGPTVGYMPQETAVYDTLTIAECMRYYGLILGASASTIGSKIKYFIELLTLPKESTIVGTLSGGQVQRVSLAIALVHEPPLLILDEPTVGVDPVIKASIWEYLIHVSQNNGTSILLSTHYIEEARKANKVGMMHNGTMAVEGSTEELIRNYNSTSLEDVFLKVCTDNKTISGECNDIGNVVYEDQCCKNVGHSHSKCRPRTIKGPTVRWTIIKATFWKNLLNLWRFYGLLPLAVLLPSIQVLLACYAFGEVIGGIPVIVINEDTGQFGDVYLSNLDRRIIVQNPSNVSSDEWRFSKNIQHYGILHIGTNFSHYLKARLIDFPMLNEEYIKGSEIRLQVDHSNFYVNLILQMELLESFPEFVTEIGPLISINSQIAEPVIRFTNETTSYFRRPATLLLISGILMISAYFASAGLVCMSQCVDINKGHMDRSFAAGVSSTEIFLSLSFLQSLICFLQNVGMVLVTLPTLNLVNRGSLFLIFLCIYLHALGGMSFGLLLSVITNKIFALTLIAAFSMSFAGLISGVFWPLESMPYFMQYLFLSLPMALPGRAVDYIIHRGWGLSNPEVLQGIGVSIAWIFILFALTVIRHSRNLNQ